MGLVLPEIIAQDQAIEALALDIARDRKRLTALEAPPEPQPLQKDRGEILRALLAANGGKALATEIRKKMHLSRAAFSLLLDTQHDYIEVKATSGNTRAFCAAVEGIIFQPWQSFQTVRGVKNFRGWLPSAINTIARCYV